MVPAQTLVMGILNVTPDSFADGGKHFEIKDALARAEQMASEGVRSEEHTSELQSH